jgi:hypothetical protein
VLFLGAVVFNVNGLPACVLSGLLPIIGTRAIIGIAKLRRSIINPDISFLSKRYLEGSPVQLSNLPLFGLLLEQSRVVGGLNMHDMTADHVQIRQIGVLSLILGKISLFAVVCAGAFLLFIVASCGSGQGP